MKDPRYKTANREAMIGIGLAAFNFIWWFSFAYGLGGRPVREYKYIFGMPAWFFYSCIVGFFVVTGLLIFCVKLFFKDIPFDDQTDEGGGRR
ncbi:DUF997 family protein [Sporolactobacillus sp. THM7-4]|nr:DUF997 family protein [Sporolactobacillus sp. THM7-4]